MDGDGSTTVLLSYCSTRSGSIEGRLFQIGDANQPPHRCQGYPQRQTVVPTHNQCSLLSEA
jgi:hypothetical protein